MSADFYLGILVSMAEGGAEVPVMLNVGGKIVCGDMISERRYFEETADRMTSDMPGLQDVFAGIPDMLDEASTDQLEDEDSPDMAEEMRKEVAQSFVHLRDSYLLSEAGGVIHMHGGLWRGKLEAVSGFWLGRPDEAARG